MPILFYNQTSQFLKYLEMDGVKFLQFWWNHIGDKVPVEKQAYPIGQTFNVEQIDDKTRL